MLRKSIAKLIIKYHKDRVNIIKTIFANFYFLSFHEAIKFPILIYGPCRIQGYGKIKLIGDIYRGMLKIGLSDPSRSCFDKTFLQIQGELICGKEVVIRRGGKIKVIFQSKLILDDYVYIGDNNTLISRREIHIGKATRIGNNTTFMDYDFHYLVNIATKSVRDYCDIIEIGENNWIGGWCTVKKGTKTPRGTILAGPYSMISKNYIGKIPEYSIIGGTPAKLIVEGMRRINNNSTQKMLSSYFKENTAVYQFPESVNLDHLCLPY